MGIFVAKVQILPDVIVNQIAAGEVVERPAAVVKELVENSIDSGAKHITIRFSHGGKYSILVEDDGCGMSPEDAILAFERHATSKITKVEDITDIHTFGFRGEAIPSIASVSMFTMRTRMAGELSGTEIVFNGGKLMHKKECGMTPGTVIKVDQLFHNTPARRLFLKTDQTEANLITNLVKNFAFAEREIKFDLYSETRKIFSSPFSKEWLLRANEVFFDEERLLPINFDSKDCKIEGAICDPTSGNLCKKFYLFFVNKRPIESKLLRAIVNDALIPALPNHRDVIACLLIDINPRFVDVNVHPTKREVRFRNEQFLRESLTQAITDALQKLPNSPKLKGSYTVTSSKTKYPSNNEARNVYSSSAYSAARSQSVNNKQIFHNTGSLSLKTNDIDDLNIENRWRLVGKVFENCAIFENESGLIVLNMRLATIKILYEKLRKNAQSKNIQTLLFPIDFSTNAVEAEKLDKVLDFLDKKGLEIYRFGRNQYRISGVPEWLSGMEAEKMTKEVAAAYSHDEKIDIDDNKKFAGLAAKYAKYEPPSTEPEMQALLSELLACENCTIGPNGYSTFFELPKCDFVKRFGHL